MKKYKLVSFLIFLGFLNSCSKDTDNMTDILTDKLWKHASYVIDWNSNQLPDDAKINPINLTMKFNADKTLVYTFNGVVQNGTWSFEMDETVIRLKGLHSDTVISASAEYMQMIYLLDNENLIFYGTTPELPESFTYTLFR